MFLYWQKKPTLSLRQFVKTYWHFKREFSPTTSHTIYPDSYYELIWVKNGSLFIDGKQAPSLFFGGYDMDKITLTGEGKVEIYGVRFFAWGLVPFIDANITKDEKFIPADKVLTPKELRHLMNLLDSSTNFYNQMNAFLTSKIIGRQLPTRIDDLSKLYVKSKGTFKVHEMAAHYNLSNRQLERLIQKSTGSTPKDLSARIRFEYVRKSLISNEHKTLSELASEHGYTDQPHLHKEFRRFTNLTPSQYKQEFNKLHAHLKPPQGWKWD
jgi:AraC-like DNA-binding protein